MADLSTATAVGSGMKIWAAFVMVGFGFFAAGCATLSRESGVAVNIVSIRPLRASLFETSVELTLRFTNESPRPLALTGSTHKLYFNGTYVGRAVTNEQLKIPELGTTTQTVTAHIENLALMNKARQLGNVVAVDYRIDSRLHATEANGGGTLAATSTGHVDLSGLLPAPAASP